MSEEHHNHSGSVGEHDGHEHEPGSMVDHKGDHDMGHAEHEPGRMVVHNDDHDMGHAETAGHVDHSDGADHQKHADHSGHEEMFRDRFWVSLLLSIPVLLYSATIQSWLSFSMPNFGGSQWITPLVSVIIFIYGGLPFIRMAIPEVRKRKPGMMTLITLAISVSFIYSLAALVFALGEGFFWELVTLIDVMLLGHWIEMRSVRQASSALDELAKLMPDEAERIDEKGNVETVRLSHLRMDDVVLVRPGESIPVDGEVVEGISKVNEALITGESKPAGKRHGDKVIAGAINGEGSLRVRVTALGNQTALAGIMRLVDEAQKSKSNTQILADRAAGWLFYIAVGSAVLTAILWTAAEGFGLFALQRVVTVLVIACPHALGLAIPLVVAISTSSLAKNGVLVRDRLALEEAREINLIVFDKTGTLTTGEQGVVAVETVGQWKEEGALALAAALEGDSEHSLAQGIRKAAKKRKLSLPNISDFKAIKGHGVEAISEGKQVYIGGPRLIKKLNLELPESLVLFAQQAGRKAQTAVYLIVDTRIIAAFALADVIRPESFEAVKNLQAMNIEVAMLTGDSKEVAKAVANQLGIDHYFAEVLPQDKEKEIRMLQTKGKRVAMVGDGVNDAPALARAEVGIAIGSGTDVAIESAGIVLVSDNPLDVLKIFILSRASYQKMIQNLVWATGYNVVAIPLAAGVLASLGIWLSPAIGALFMSISTIIVAINAQLLRNVKLSRPIVIPEVATA